MGVDSMKHESKDGGNKAQLSMNAYKIMQNDDMKPTPCKKDEEGKLVTKQCLWGFSKSSRPTRCLNTSMKAKSNDKRCNMKSKVGGMIWRR